MNTVTILPYSVGYRVRITAGGHRGELGTVRTVNPHWPAIVVTLDSGMLWYDDGHRLEYEPMDTRPDDAWEQRHRFDDVGPGEYDNPREYMGPSNHPDYPQ